MSRSANHVPWYEWCLWYSQLNYLFARLSSTWDDSNVLKKSQKWCNKAAVSCIFFSEVVTIKIICFSLKDFRQQSPPGGTGGVLTYITYTGMCRPTGSWFWSSWFRTGYPFQRRFLERGMKNCGSRLYLLLKIVVDYEEAFIWCISRTNKEIFNLQTS